MLQQNTLGPERGWVGWHTMAAVASPDSGSVDEFNGLNFGFILQLRFVGLWTGLHQFHEDILLGSYLRRLFSFHGRSSLIVRDDTRRPGGRTV